MHNFTELFGAALNATITNMVNQAVSDQQCAVSASLSDRVYKLEGVVSRLLDRNLELELALNGRIDTALIELKEHDHKDDISREIDAAIEVYDFSDIVSNELDWNSMSGDADFASAVTTVVRDALRG